MFMINRVFSTVLTHVSCFPLLLSCQPIELTKIGQSAYTARPANDCHCARGLDRWLGYYIHSTPNARACCLVLASWRDGEELSTLLDFQCRKR